MQKRLGAALRSATWFLLQLAPVIAAVLALLDLTGAFNRVPALKADIPAITLFVLAVILESVIAIRKKLAAIQSSLRAESSRSGSIESALKDIKSDLNRSPLEPVRNLKTQLDPGSQKSSLRF